MHSYICASAEVLIRVHKQVAAGIVSYLCIRYIALASAFNIAIIIAGLTPIIAAALVDVTNDLFIPAYYLMLVGIIGIVTGICLKETANRPLRGVSPSASNKQEARELLVQTYQHIEQSVDDIDAEIARLQEQIGELEKRKQQYIDLHPKLE